MPWLRGSPSKRYSGCSEVTTVSLKLTAAGGSISLCLTDFGNGKTSWNRRRPARVWAGRHANPRGLTCSIRRARRRGRRVVVLFILFVLFAR